MTTDKTKVTLTPLYYNEELGCVVHILPNGSYQRCDYFENPKQPLRVVIHVRGGVAEVFSAPAEVEVVIIDHDNEE